MTGELPSTLRDLGVALTAAELALEVPGVAETRRVRDELVAQTPADSAADGGCSGGEGEAEAGGAAARHARRPHSRGFQL